MQLFPGGDAPTNLEPSLAYTASPLMIRNWLNDLRKIVADAQASGKVRKGKSIPWGQTDYIIWRDPYGDGSDKRDYEFQSVLTLATQLQILVEEKALLAGHWEVVGRRPWALVETDGTKLGQYHVLDLLIHGFTGKLLKCDITGVPTYNCPTFGQLGVPTRGVPYLAVSAARATNGDLCFLAINRDSKRTMPLRFDIGGFPAGETVKATARTLSAPTMLSPPEEMTVTRKDLRLENTARRKKKLSVAYEFPPRSMTVLRLAKAASR